MIILPGKENCFVEQHAAQRDDSHGEEGNVSHGDGVHYRSQGLISHLSLVTLFMCGTLNSERYPNYLIKTRAYYTRCAVYYQIYLDTAIFSPARTIQGARLIRGSRVYKCQV